MQAQATKHTQKQLAYLAYWQQRGYTFARNDVIPESITTPPRHRASGTLPSGTTSPSLRWRWLLFFLRLSEVEYEQRTECSPTEWWLANEPMHTKRTRSE
jgi:hypothetical protein